MDDTIADAEVTDEELTALALAADPDTAVGPDSVPIDLWAGDSVDHGRTHPLPEWYMPIPRGEPRALHGWRRRVVWLVVASFVLINAYGLCSTYGIVTFG
ncbi:MAG: hypothetical protein QOE93_63 [Actinomycetota bacterium]|nr:hypothetical protein [Actinomycetota bacterium]